jgi:hypothetical protein
MDMCAEHHSDGTFEDAIAGFNCILGIYFVAESVRYALSMGLLPVVSSAFPLNQASRMFLTNISCLLNQFRMRSWYLSVHCIWSTPSCNVGLTIGDISKMGNSNDESHQLGGNIRPDATATVDGICATFVAFIGATILLYYSNDVDRDWFGICGSCRMVCNTATT